MPTNGSSPFSSAGAWLRPLRCLAAGSFVFFLFFVLFSAPPGAGAEGAVGEGAASAPTAVSNATTGSQASHVHTIPLRKQYVPIKGSTGSIVAYKTAYFGQIHVGAPEPQAFTVVFDTGSGHLILPSTVCTSETCAKHRRFSLEASGSAVDIDHEGTPLAPGIAPEQRNQVAITFGTGQVMGQFVRDDVCLGPPRGDTSSSSGEAAAAGVAAAGVEKGCVDLRVVLATSMTPEPFGLFAFDGVLGLGMQAMALSPQFSFFEQISAQNPSMKPLFSVFLARNDDGQSAISFGGLEERWAASEVKWAPVAMPELGYWQVQIKSLSIGGTVIEDCSDGGCRAILDTGTSLLGVPRQSLRTMHRLLARPLPAETEGGPADPSETDCRSVPGAQIVFELEGGAVITLGTEDYSRPRPLNMTLAPAPAPGADAGADSTAAPSGPGWQLMCRSLLLPLDMQAPLGPKIFIWGEPLLRKYYTVYDWSVKRIGFSTAGTGPQRQEDAGAIDAPPTGSLAAGAPLTSTSAPPSSAGSAPASVTV